MRLSICFVRSPNKEPIREQEQDLPETINAEEVRPEAAK